MTASLAAAIRRHVEELESKPRKVFVNFHEWQAVHEELADFELVSSIWIVSASDVPRGCWRLPKERACR